jgi:hypothetical protein
MTTRRTFVSWLSSLAAALGIGVRPRAGAAVIVTAQSAGLDASILRAVADSVLPSELGSDGVARVSRAFSQWIYGYRAGVELVHAYGSTTLRQTGVSPAARWRSQLAALDADARSKHQRAFASLTTEQRRELVTTALAGDRLTRLPEPLDAQHVAMALLAWYFASPDAVDLCYNAKIGRNSCRPLVNAPRQPSPVRELKSEMGDLG